MTICIGLLASDGVVIAADSEESAGYAKRSQQKIFTWIGNISTGADPKPPESACAFTGAGDAGYIDAFTGHAIKGLRAGMSQVELQDYLEAEIRDFHVKHIFPWANPPDFQMVIGAYSQLQTAIFVTYGSTLRRALPHAAIGIGPPYALSLMDDLAGIKDVKRTEILAAYIVFATKDRVEGCGKFTTIVSLHSPSIVDAPGEPSRLVPPQLPKTHLAHGVIQKWEESFRRT
jgi:hypothetical protein